MAELFDMDALLFSQYVRRAFVPERHQHDLAPIASDPFTESESDFLARAARHWAARAIELKALGGRPKANVAVDDPASPRVE